MFHVDQPKETFAKANIALTWAAVNFTEKNAVSKMIEMTGLSSRQLLIAFKKHTNKNPSDYIRLLRMSEAIRLLETTHKSIDEIGFQVGYDDQGTFYDLFRRMYSTTPGEYRKAYRAAKELQ